MHLSTVEGRHGGPSAGHAVTITQEVYEKSMELQKDVKPDQGVSAHVPPATDEAGKKRDRKSVV